MQVLKFGGTSVANAENMGKAIAIIENALKKDSTLVVLSTMGEITDSLMAAAETGANGDEHYKNKLQEIDHRHLEAVKQLIPVMRQSSVLSMVKKQCNEIEDICNGIF